MGDWRLLPSSGFFLAMIVFGALFPSNILVVTGVGMAVGTLVTGVLFARKRASD